MGPPQPGISSQAGPFQGSGKGSSRVKWQGISLSQQFSYLASGVALLKVRKYIGCCIRGYGRIKRCQMLGVMLVVGSSGVCVGASLSSDTLCGAEQACPARQSSLSLVHYPYLHLLCNIVIILESFNSPLHLASPLDSLPLNMESSCRRKIGPVTLPLCLLSKVSNKD